jgi:hypothetical protein
VFGTSGFTGQLIGDPEWSGITRESIATSHHATTLQSTDEFGSKTFIPSDLVDPGTLSMTVHANTLQTDATDQPPVGLVAETVTLTWPKAAGDTTAATWASSGFVTECTATWPLEDVVAFDITVKLTGNVTVTAAT